MPPLADSKHQADTPMYLILGLIVSFNTAMPMFLMVVMLQALVSTCSRGYLGGSDKNRVRNPWLCGLFC